jgi:4'-phosphopantetheinyl transferase EntD
VAENNSPQESFDLTVLLPDGVVVVAVEPRHRTMPLHPEEARLALRRSMHPRREREFRAGRACAREALAQFGFGDWPLLPAAARDPQWPAGMIGSITHCGSYCAAAVTRASGWSGIGIDVEAIDRVGAALAPQICTRPELRALERRSAQSAGGFLCLMFSAKESVFKAVFPVTRRLFDFTDIEIDFEIARKSFGARSRDGFVDRVLRGLRGRFGTSPAFAFTTALVGH